MNVQFTALDLGIVYIAANSSAGNPDHWESVDSLIEGILRLTEDEQKESGLFYPAENAIGFMGADPRNQEQVAAAVELADSVMIDREAGVRDLVLMSTVVRGGSFERLLGRRAKVTRNRLAALQQKVDAESKFKQLPEETREKLLDEVRSRMGPLPEAPPTPGEAAPGEDCDCEEVSAECGDECSPQTCSPDTCCPSC